ncbi:unnamed protein product [Moneuplotes crassus]|uniref:GMP phosphodiesterase delta subunit domain-containing protein n=1 Tax=Euplotes crassus TaxID=5936 RepID=A0AAD2D5C2_EUPCR|nr:unnamed protein product [Moneuplotes crassus]
MESDLTVEMVENFSPEDAKAMDKPAEMFYCKPSDNTYKIKFIRYKLRDYDSGITLADLEHPDIDEEQLLSDEIPDEERVINYKFGPDFLDLQTIGTQLEFAVGDKEVKDFLMIEKHYFKDRILKDYMFDFKFCIPNTVNTWEQIYDLPELTDEEKEEIIENPYEVKSDTFFFVQDKLVMHSRAIYDYSPFDV